MHTTHSGLGIAGFVRLACLLAGTAAGLASCGDSEATDPATDVVQDTADGTVASRAGLCNPCNANADCQGPTSGEARCVDHGDLGAFCGAACSTDTDCTDGYVCADSKDVTGAAVKQCVVKAGGECACSAEAMANEWATTCFVSSAAAVGKCTGTRACLASGKPGAPSGGGLAACSAPAPSAEICDGKDNDCNGKTDDAVCDDGSACTDDLCKPTGECTFTPRTGACDADGSACTANDTCVEGKCKAGPVLVCDDGNPCTDDVCDLAIGCTVTDNVAPCDADGDGCTVGDVCQGGTCQAGALKACESGESCITGSCDKATGNCKFVLRPDGYACDDGSPCTADDSCAATDTVTSVCNGINVSCDDLNTCTSDSCDPASGCKHANIDGTVCSDGNGCTDSETCKGGVCLGLAIDVTTTCDDQDPCTADSCLPAQGCVHDKAGASGVACNDGNPCTEGDLCSQGECVSGQNNCKCVTDVDCVAQEDGNPCNGTLFCDKNEPAQSVCNVDKATVVVCDVSLNTQCQSVACSAVTGLCVVAQQPAGLGCDADGSLCTVGDKCQDGACTPGSVQVCDDVNPCTDDSCDPKAGCEYVASTSPCDADGNACTVADVCSNGTCLVGKAKVCDDGETCTKDSCDSSNAACVFVPIPKSCDDANACTKGDACGVETASGLYTCVGGAAVSCDDGNPCTIDSCDAVKGCSNAVDTTVKTACYTGDPKTRGKGKCKDGIQKCQDDGKLTACLGAVVPALTELCNGIDDTCEGITDENCSPGAFTGDFGVADFIAKGPTYGTASFAGGSFVVGDATGLETYTATYGWYLWLKAFVGL
jgi:hypothetical protein